MHMSRTIVSSVLVWRESLVSQRSGKSRRGPISPAILTPSLSRFPRMAVRQRGNTRSTKPVHDRKISDTSSSTSATAANESPTIGSIVSVTVNGEDWSDRIESSEGGGTGCESRRPTS